MFDYLTNEGNDWMSTLPAANIHERLSDLRNEFGDEFYVEKINTGYHIIVYKNIIVGINSKSYKEVRQEILKIKDAK